MIHEFDRPKLEWTRECPKESGWYWLKNKCWGAIIVRVIYHGLYVIGPDFGMSTDRLTDAEWAGPLIEPEHKEQEYD